MLFLREKSSLCREKVAILPKNLRKVKNMQKKRNFYLQQLIDGKILENTQIFLAETLENTQIFGLPAKACGRFQTFLLFFLRGFLFYFKQCSFISILYKKFASEIIISLCSLHSSTSAFLVLLLIKSS